MPPMVVAAGTRRGKRLRGPILLACAAACYFAAAHYLKATYDPHIVTPNIAGRKVLIQRPFTSFSGSRFAVSAADNWYTEDADSPDEPFLSDIIIYEDETRLGPPHTKPLGD